jgi:GDP-4-dehydro-6-deoxy-D-mannose reductase
LRVLITGASGFAGGYLARACCSAGDSVLGLSRSSAVPPGAGEGRAIDLLDAGAFGTAVREFEPEVVCHLAALSSVGRSWEQPAQTMQGNAVAAANVLEAVRLEAPGARVVWVSSCEVYGSADRLPIDEQAPLRPANPYAVSKLAGELLAAVYAEAHGLGVVRVRPFNHTGPGQPSVFVSSSLARQAAEARLRGARSVTLVTGNPDTRRDFIDVRDAVRAYRLLAERAHAGEVYNVSSGESISTAEQVGLIAEVIAPIEVEHVVDPDRVRAHEVMDLRGSHDRLTAATGWQPEIPLRQTVAETIAWWEERLSGGA